MLSIISNDSNNTLHHRNKKVKEFDTKNVYFLQSNGSFGS